MIVHMVLLRIRRNVQMREVEQLFAAIGALQRKIPGITGFSWGPNTSPTGLNKGFTHGFCMGFRDAAARDAYLPHPEHMQVQALVGNVVEGGVEGVLEFDYRREGERGARCARNFTTIPRAPSAARCSDSHAFRQYRRLPPPLFLFGARARWRHDGERCAGFARGRVRARAGLTNEFLCEGANFADIDKDGHNDIVAGPYWWEGPRFDKRHEIYAPFPFDPAHYSDAFFVWPWDVDGDGWMDSSRSASGRRPTGTATRSRTRSSSMRTGRSLIFANVSNESPAFVDLVGDGRRELVFNTDTHFAWAERS
ncbi:MAG: Dabb family protein [Planctomycetes bacterium]|nr:Dabb family protein [Planctomycetota bacterium]